MSNSKSGDTPSLRRVFIGMPVYNEDAYIADALTDLVSQDYPAYTVLISDNGSTDRTGAICETFARQHANVHYLRNEHNLGSNENFRRVLESAAGDYFMWASGHDRWDSNYLSTCVQALETHPDAAIAFGTGDWIGTQSEPLERESGWTDTRGMTPIARYFSVIWGNMHPILGLIRLDHLRRAGEMKALIGADLVILTELVLMGDFIHAVDTHWSRRANRVSERYADKLKRYRSQQFAATKSRVARAFPLAELPIQLFRVVFRSKLTFSEKLMLSLLLPPTFGVKYLSSRY